jgi:hypothetical protein
VGVTESFAYTSMDGLKKRATSLFIRRTCINTSRSDQCSWFSGYQNEVIEYVCGNYDVERQKHNKLVNYTQDSSIFPRRKEELP